MPSRCPAQEFVPASHLSGRNPNDQEEPSFQGKKPVSMLGRAGDAYMVSRLLATDCSRCGLRLLTTPHRWRCVSQMNNQVWHRQAQGVYFQFRGT